MLFLTQHYASFLKGMQLVLMIEPLTCLQKLKGNSEKGTQRFSPAKLPATKDAGRTFTQYLYTLSVLSAHAFPQFCVDALNSR